MANLKSPKLNCLCSLLFLLSIQTKILCYSIYKVGDLNAWGNPPSSNPQVYNQWCKYHNLKIGDSLFFLYPPSQDSVIQVTGDSYNSCNLKDPILYMNDGNSLFNITKPGDYYFTSGVEGHCQKSQKLRISVYGNGSYADSSPAYSPSASAPSYPTVFGSIPIQGSGSASDSASASPLLKISIFFPAAIGFVISLLVIGKL